MMGQASDDGPLLHGETLVFSWPTEFGSYINISFDPTTNFLEYYLLSLPRK
jgi:hypothetical protein